jgi:hypothetical protein
MVAYSFQGRFVDPIKRGLGLPFGSLSALTLPKRQTIRAIGRRRHARPGDVLQLYRGMRTKQCFLIGTARCTEIAPIIIWVNHETMAIERSKALLGRPEMEQFAREDGFADAADMASFWLQEHPGEKFDGLLIKWEPIDA